MALLALLFACGSPPIPRYAEVSRGGDGDGDGAADIDDACPADPEDGLPPKANDGCPASDPDNDGVLLGADTCPDAKEDGQPPSPGDGCPLADADQDGVADASDKCPGPLEDNHPPDPSDGCPAPDGDHDGIVDANDDCPAEPETRNGFRDDDGCPDTPGDRIVFDKGSSTIYIPESKKIDFDSDSTELSAAAQATVREVADVMKQNPEIQRLEIEGHASSKGDDGYNVQLTERRAAAVGRALVSQGVQAQRLVTIGYGEYCPAVEEEDGADTPANRRVLFKTVVVNGVWQDVPRGCWRAQTKGINPTKRQPGVSAAPAGPIRPTGGA